jgi:hypothetical protein
VAVRGQCQPPAYQIAVERLGAGDPAPAVVAFPTPAYDPDLDRFELTAKGRAALDASAHSPA